jgi:hypothetical protein
VNGYREGRSPDVLGVGDGVGVVHLTNGVPESWPAEVSIDDGRIPIALWGAGVKARASVPAGAGLDQIAPTVSEILGFARPFPQVRSGSPLEGLATGEAPQLVLLIAWKWTGSRELEDSPRGWPFLASLLEHGAGTLEGRTGSLPLDPAATLTTIGTGGIPSQHGITGSIVRNDSGEITAAFGPDAPVQVIATLADDLDEHDGATLVGLVATAEGDRGIVGGGWYEEADPPEVAIGDPGAAPRAVENRLEAGFGADSTPDILGVVLEGRVRSMDGLTRRIVEAAEQATDGAVLVVVAGTGSTEHIGEGRPDEALVDAVEAAVPGAAPAVAAVVPGGLFLDQDVLAARHVTGQVAVEALRSVESTDGGAMLADAFQGFAVSFARYC